MTNTTKRRTLTALPAKILKDWATQDEACEQLGITITTLWRKRRDDRLISRAYMGRVLISRASLKKFLAHTLDVV